VSSTRRKALGTIGVHIRYERIQCWRGGLSPIPVNLALRYPLHIGIEGGSIHEPQRIGLGVAAQRWIVLPVPVVVQAGFGLEPLAGEAGVEGGGAVDHVGGAERLPEGIPDQRLGRSRHLDRTVEVVDADAPECTYSIQQFREVRFRNQTTGYPHCLLICN
jgi:hypothetical protein